MKKVLIIDNGGTVSMKRIKGTLRSVDGKEDIKKSIFELKQSVEIFYVKVNQIDSTNLYPPIMKKVFDTIVKNYNFYDGFVVLTGTDTLAYLACFLSFWLREIHKPVVLTGSQKPLNMLGSDAPANIYYSILFACENIPEITVFFGKKLFRGNRVTKLDSQGFDAFDSPNYLPIGHVDALRHRIRGPLESLLRPSLNEIFKYAWSSSVHISTIYPGFSPKILSMLSNLNYKGLIIEAFGLGNLPNQGIYSLEPVIKELNQKGMLVAVISSCLRGSAQVEYDTAKTFERQKVLFLEDITKEAAYAKMSYLFGVKNDIEEIRKLMLTSISGEMTDKI